jgi:hypothetical protein
MTGRHHCTHERSCSACLSAGRAHWSQRAKWHIDRDRRAKTWRRRLGFAAGVIALAGLVIAAVLGLASAGPA